MKKTLIVLCFLSISIIALSKPDQDSIPEVSGNYLDISAGLTFGSLRDMSISPLFYTGLLPAIEIKSWNYFGKNLFTADLDSYNGMYFTSTENDFYSGSANIIDFELSYFRNYDEYVNGVLGHWPGFSLSNYTSLRINSNFGNAAFSFDNISSLNFNYMLTKRWTRKAKEKKFLWLFKYTKKQKEFLLTFKTGLPIYSIIYRPGYTSPGNSTIPDILLPGYEVSGKVFSGMNTNLSLSRILANGNMIRFAYNWDFFTSGKYSLNRLDSSRHTFLFSLVFKLK